MAKSKSKPAQQAAPVGPYWHQIAAEVGAPIDEIGRIKQDGGLMGPAYSIDAMRNGVLSVEQMDQMLYRVTRGAQGPMGSERLSPETRKFAERILNAWQKGSEFSLRPDRSAAAATSKPAEATASKPAAPAANGSAPAAIPAPAAPAAPPAIWANVIGSPSLMPLDQAICRFAAAMPYAEDWDAAINAMLAAKRKAVANGAAARRGLDKRVASFEAGMKELGVTDPAKITATRLRWRADGLLPANYRFECAIGAPKREQPASATPVDRIKSKTEEANQTSKA